MSASEDRLVRAWSNGRWLYLDLERNRYLAGPEDPDGQERMKQFAAAARLRECLQVPGALVPPPGVIGHYVRCAAIAWRARRAPIRRQLDLLKARGRERDPRSSARADVEWYAMLYQNLRNLRFRRPACLEDSIACALFLQPYVTPVTFHIGVRQPPFQAHAWVQSGDMILNDAKQSVEDYSEILRVPV